MISGGWLEHEIRSLPQVLACSVTEDDVVVLIQPAADPASVERAVGDVLRRVGMWRPIRVFGGVRPALAEPVRIRSSARSAFVGALSGAAVLAIGVWIAGATTGVRATKPDRVVAEPAPLPPPIVRDIIRVPNVLPERFTPPPPPEPPAAPPVPEPPAGPDARPASPPILRPVRRPPVLAPLPPDMRPLPPAPSPPAEPDDDDDEDDDERDQFEDDDVGEDDDDDARDRRLRPGHGRGVGHERSRGKGHDHHDH